MTSRLLMVLIVMGLSALMTMGCSATPRDWNVLDFGAIGDGRADNTTAFQKAIDLAYEAGGGIVRVPTGQYRINGNLLVPSAVVLQGTFRNAASGYHDPGREFEGSTLLAFAGRGSSEGKPFIHLSGRMATLAGFLIRYPEATCEEVPPVPYPPCVAISEWDCAVIDCCLLNAYQAVHVKNGGRHLLRNVHGYPTWRGIYIDYNQDIGRLENCHFSPRGFEFNPTGKYMQWVFRNGTAFEFAHTDWQYVTNTFCFGYRIGYRFTESKTGHCNGNFLGIGADSCWRPVLVEQASPVGLLITNGEFVGQWGTKDSTCVEVMPSCRGRVNLANCSFWGPNDRLVWLRSPRAQVIMTGCNLVEWDNDYDGSPAVQLDAGRAIIQGCTFTESPCHVRIGERMLAATVIGNQSEGGFRVENRASRRATRSANEEETMVWTDEARGHYRVQIGEAGDTRYLRGFYASQQDEPWGGKSTMRWAGPRAEFSLPLQPGTKYEITVEVFVPEHAVSAENGLYLADGLLAGLPKQGVFVIKAAVPPQTAERVTFGLRAKTWVPSDVRGEREMDERRLTVAVRSVTVKAEGAATRVFDANTGFWPE